MNTVKELIVDAYGCQGDLSDPNRFESLIRDAVSKVGASFAHTVHHRFVPHGLTVCAILKESHFILSTWPEHELVIANIFLCNDAMDARRCWKVLEAELLPKHTVLHFVPHQIGDFEKRKTG